jgi:glutamate/tyrosine decarboxylase-like PLP-dependent enzyme
MKDIFSKVLDSGFALSDKKLTNPKTPQELRETFDLSLEKSAYTKDLGKLIDGIFENSVNTQNPRFLNQLYGGSTKEAWLGELLTSILNTSMATYEIAPLATLMEKEVLAAINEEIGFEQFNGLMAPGGSYANMLGINCARFAHSADLKTKGLESNKYRVFVSEDAHYSSEKALGLMGLGMKSLIKVKTDDKKRMSISALKSEIEKCKREGLVPLCVVSTAATTVWGSYDSIDEIQDLCTQENIWHHVDAAWGGLALWSDKKDTLFKGVDRVDSITLDFHKLMASTLTKGVFITSRPEILKGANSGGGTKYIFHNSDDESASMDTGTYALQCGRRVNSLPLWLQWKMGGTEQYTNKVSELYDLVDETVTFVRQNSEYRLLLEPEFMNICFQVLPSDDKVNVGDFNRKMRDLLMERGNFMVNFSSTPEDGAFFRLVLSHWGVTSEILKEFFVELQAVKSELEEK